MSRIKAYNLITDKRCLVSQGTTRAIGKDYNFEENGRNSVITQFDKPSSSLKVSDLIRESREIHLRRSFDFQIFSTKKKHKSKLEAGEYLRENYTKTSSRINKAQESLRMSCDSKSRECSRQNNFSTS